MWKKAKNKRTRKGPKKKLEQGPENKLKPDSGSFAKTRI